jgi:hypothetical protein
MGREAYEAVGSEGCAQPHSLDCKFMYLICTIQLTHWGFQYLKGNETGEWRHVCTQLGLVAPSLLPLHRFQSMSGSRLCLLFPCGPKTVCDLGEVAANFDSLTRPGCLTSKSAPIPIHILPGAPQAQSYLVIRYCPASTDACVRWCSDTPSYCKSFLHELLPVNTTR